MFKKCNFNEKLLLELLLLKDMTNSQLAQSMGTTEAYVKIIISNLSKKMQIQGINNLVSEYKKYKESKK